MPKPAAPLHRAAIALGSNLPSQAAGREQNLTLAIRRLGKLGEVTAVSSFFDTAPVAYTDQPRFLNAAALLRTALGPEQLLEALLAIELEMGRDRSEAVPPKGPRILDLDLLWFDELVLQTPELTLPHPAMHGRRFVLEPLAEIAPDWYHPLSKRTVRELLAEVSADPL